MKNINTLIIGAGVSGLTFAVNCKNDYLIVEAENRPGGLCKSFYEGEYVWDYAGHFFHFANPKIKEFFEREISEYDMVKCTKNTNINYYGTIVDYPFQMNIHELPKDEFIDCLYDLYVRNEKDEYKSFEDMLYGKFGISITEKFLKPYNEKLYACDLNELDTDAMGRFFPYANPEQIIKNMKQKQDSSYNNIFDYPRKGAQFFIDILMEKIDSDRILFNSRVEEVDIESKTAIINGELYQFEKLISTMPLNHFVKILHSGYAEIVGDSLSCNKVLVFNLGFNKEATDKAVHWTYIPMKDVNFYRIGFYNNILGSEKLSMYVEIGYSENEEVDVDKQLELTIKSLKDLGVITDHKLVAYNSLIINPGYVHITKESNEKVANFMSKINKHNAYSIGRYGKWTYCSIEDCMIEAINLSNSI